MTTAERIAKLKPNTPVKSWRKDKKNGGPCQKRQQNQSNSFWTGRL